MLDVDHVSKTYGSRKVLDDVAFSVRPGRLTGFVGANGAGKTTTMRIILGLVRPDAGRALIDTAVEYATELGCKTVDLTSRPSRKAANRLYQSCGFQLRETNVYRH